MPYYKWLIWYFLRYITAWANLIDSLLAVVSFGFLWTSLGFKCIGIQTRYMYTHNWRYMTDIHDSADS